MNIFRGFIACISFALITGCAHNVTFYKEIESGEKSEIQGSNVAKLYVDSYGNIYPEEKGMKRFGDRIVENARLYNEFSCNKELCATFDNVSSPYISKLCDSTKFSTCTTENSFVLPDEKWRSVQTLLWQNKGKEIYEGASQDNKDILVMIHGFNNYPSEASRSFELIRKRVQSLEDEKSPFFVEIYWDGFKGLPLSGSWSKAQTSGPLVGFQLRQLFKAIESEYKKSGKNKPKLMFITHSSGAFVAGSLLGNPYSALPLLNDDSKNPPPEYREFSAKRDGKNEKYPIPNFPEIRLGMIAAATPSNTFTGNPIADEDIEEGILSKNTKLFFTINWKDIALTKFVGLMNVNPSGATGSGQDEDLYCDYLKEVKGQQSKAFDLSEGGFLFWNSHGLNSYLERKNSNDFIKAVLGHDIKTHYTCS